MSAPLLQTLSHAFSLTLCAPPPGPRLHRATESPDDSVGFWHVATHPSQDKQTDWSRVYYSVQLRIPSWIPGIVIGYLNKKAIREVGLRRAPLLGLPRVCVLVWSEEAFFVLVFFLVSCVSRAACACRLLFFYPECVCVFVEWSLVVCFSHLVCLVCALCLPRASFFYLRERARSTQVLLRGGTVPDTISTLTVVLHQACA